MEVTGNILVISYETASVFYRRLYKIIDVVLKILWVSWP